MDKVIIQKDREITEVIETIYSLLNHIQTLRREIKYLDIDSEDIRA